MRPARIGVLGDRADGDVIDYVVAAQAEPTRHVTLVGVGDVAVRNDVRAVTRWRDRTLVALDSDDHVVGVLVADVDPELGRCYWLGPWANHDEVAAALLAAAEPLVVDAPHRFFAPDARNTGQGRLAVELGYAPGEPSAILELDLTTWQEPTGAMDVRPLAPGDHDAVAALHDRLFPDTHTPGHRLVRDDDTTILVTGSPPHGYVATQPQSDNSLYIDYVGVDEPARRQGLARALVTAALRTARADGLHQAFLTVHVRNAGARGLYAALGFTEERQAQPFTLDGRR